MGEFSAAGAPEGKAQKRRRRTGPAARCGKGGEGSAGQRSTTAQDEHGRVTRKETEYDQSRHSEMCVRDSRTTGKGLGGIRKTGGDRRQINKGACLLGTHESGATGPPTICATFDESAREYKRQTHPLTRERKLAKLEPNRRLGNKFFSFVTVQ